MSLNICVKGGTLRMHGDAFLQLININIDINTLFTQYTHPRGYLRNIRIQGGILKHAFKRQSGPSLRGFSTSC